MDSSIFKTLGFLIILISLLLYSDEIGDDDKNNVEDHTTDKSIDINELYKTKCINNINAPFDDYNLQQYNYDSDEYKHCTLESKKNIIESMDKNWNDYIHYYYQRNSEIEMQDYLQLLCSSENLNPLSTYVLGNYCSNIPSMIVTAITANEMLKFYDEKLTKNNENYIHMEQLYEISTQTGEEIKKFIDDITHALSVCAKPVVNDVSLYNSIESKVNIREKLPEIWTSYRTLNKNLKQKCDEVFDFAEYDTTIKASLNAYYDTIELLSKKKNVMVKLLNNLKKIHKDYNDWSMKKYDPIELKHDFDKTNTKYMQQDYVILRKHGTKVTDWEEYVRKISVILSQLPSTKQDQLKQAIQQLTQYTSENIKITEVDSEILALLKSNDVSIRNLILEINGIEIEHKKQSLSVDLTINVLHTVNLIIHNWFHDHQSKQESYDKLTQFQKSKNEYVYITDESGIDKIKSDTNEFEKKVKQTKASLLQLKTKINDFMISIDMNMENIQINGDVLANLFNKLSPYYVDKPTDDKPTPTTPKTDMRITSKKIGLILGVTFGCLSLIVIVTVVLNRKKMITCNAIASNTQNL